MCCHLPNKTPTLTSDQQINIYKKIYKKSRPEITNP